MVIINPAPAALSPDDLSLFYTTDDLLSGSPILVFYGPTATSTQATHSRIQAHVFSPAGLQHFARLIISPTATFYSAVTCLPREEQGDEICRGLAFSLYKYFAELPINVKNTWEKQCNSLGNLPSAPKLFTESHAAMLASRMVRVQNVPEIINDVRQSLAEQALSWLDLDVVLPAGAIQKLDNPRESSLFDESEDDILQERYGQYAPIVKLFGDAAFLPTSKLRRAPSKPTALNKTQSFSRKQKENLRREMCELLDTEESFVSKIYDLIHSVAADFRQKAKSKGSGSSSPSEQALKGLFPPSLDKILEVNLGFMEAIRKILEETENDAIQDIESANDSIYVAPLRGQKDVQDVTGAFTIAKELVEWFPKFADCYTDYIQAHSDFSQFLKVFMKETGSSFSKRVHETGEQRLMSMLIEPVQRLPRYNLYIDNIVKQLPVRHPALKPFLKARDIISEICSRDSPSSQQMKVIERLRKLVFSWPPNFQPQGRLITAVDVVELPPPYHPELHGPGSTSGILLLFADFLVLLHKPSGSNVTARSIISDVDNAKGAESSSGPSGLIFHQHIKLSDVLLSEYSCGKIVQLISPTTSASQGERPRSRDCSINNIGIRIFYLSGSYEGKAHRWIEEVVKARVEGRFSESERESHKWEVRSISGELGLFSALFESSEGQNVEGRREPAKIRVVVDPAKTSKEIKVGEEGVEAVVSISILNADFYLLEITGLNDYGTRDCLTGFEFLPVLTKRYSPPARSCLSRYTAKQCVATHSVAY
ncbi:Dbl homology domain-containing protein [Lepidopterella palustris CBS 459.81]|uniref:Dbl homology domain-containing protein n=1 Tax=Lepidopterella palustris CBS 459.81 TaxID=1314670 RepID=A0A8E2E812_9PEZI|nr:Dbl homology domain-containing protein [Lepidopterella palustris CBS 459.81]